MGDTCVIARRLQDGHVQYGWGGNGGYCAHTGLRLLEWYDSPDRVEYLFSLGQVSGLGPPGSEHGRTLPRNSPTGTPHWLGSGEEEIFSQIAFVDYAYFYDLDERWYYVSPGQLCVKLPLELVAARLEDGLWGPQEYSFLKAVQLRIVEEIAGTLYQTDGAFRKHAAELGYTRKAMAAIALEAEDLFAKGGYALSQLGENHRRLLAWLDRWVVIRPAGDGTLGQIVFRSKGDRHIETNKW